MKILFVQFANSMFLRHEECDGYWDAFYNAYNNFGYWRGKYCFEIPKWIAEIDFLLDKKIYEREIYYCQNNVSEVIKKINDYNPEYTLFSLMDCNKNFIEKIVKELPNNKFIIGGYNNEFLTYLDKTYKQVYKVNTIEDDAKILGVPYKMGTDYSLFKGETVLPRLTLSYGCLNKCKFCTIPHGKVIPIEDEIIIQQVESFKDLKFKLIYIDDKTFGQCDNYTILPKLTEIIKEYNPQFEGYVIQTTSGMVRKKYKEFIDLGVKVAEIGMETYNDEILREYNKPSSCKFIDDCVQIAKENNELKLILNVVIGFPEETSSSYGRTYHLIEENLTESVFGINPAIYTDYSDTENNQGEIDFQESDKIDLHREWWNKINKLGKDLLNGSTNNITNNT